MWNMLPLIVSSRAWGTLAMFQLYHPNLFGVIVGIIYYAVSYTY